MTEGLPRPPISESEYRKVLRDAARVAGAHTGCRGFIAGPVERQVPSDPRAALMTARPERSSGRAVAVKDGSGRAVAGFARGTVFNYVLEPDLKGFPGRLYSRRSSSVQI
jgi:hypothetical protein